MIGAARRPDSAADLLRKYPDTFRRELLDVTDAATVRDVVDRSFTSLGRIDVALSNGPRPRKGGLPACEELSIGFVPGSPLGPGFLTGKVDAAQTFEPGDVRSWFPRFTEEADCIRIIHRALDAGINFIDTADVYSAGESEKIVGKALAGRRDDIVLATKFFMPVSGADPNMRGGSRRWIIRAVENSLRHLGSDYIDLYQVHRPSADTDVEETLGALSDLVRAGKVRYIGSSSYAASQIVEAQWTARDRHLERFVTEQPPYSILVRSIEADVLPTARRHGMGILSYSPLGGGWLSGRWRKDAASGPASAARPSARLDMTSPANQRKLEVVEELAQLADKTGLTLIELAIAFVINHPAVTAAIIGPRTTEQLESQLPAAEVTLSADILDHIDQLVAPGVTINPDDNSYGEAELTPAALRRTS